MTKPNLQEIRQRVEAAKNDPTRLNLILDLRMPRSPMEDLAANAPSDIPVLLAYVEELQSENATLRNAQKACETCDGPTMEKVKKMEAGMRLILTAHERGFDIHYAMGVAEEALHQLTAKGEVKP